MKLIYFLLFYEKIKFEIFIFHSLFYISNSSFVLRMMNFYYSQNIKYICLFKLFNHVKKFAIDLILKEFLFPAVTFCHCYIF